MTCACARFTFDLKTLLISHRIYKFHLTPDAGLNFFMLNEPRVSRVGFGNNIFSVSTAQCTGARSSCSILTFVRAII